MDATTWDGLPISTEPPYGAAIAVWRAAEASRCLPPPVGEALRSAAAWIES